MLPWSAAIGVSAAEVNPALLVAALPIGVAISLTATALQRRFWDR